MLVSLRRVYTESEEAQRYSGQTRAVPERAGEVVDKSTLFKRVWGVGDGALRVHLAGLRKALGDRKDGARYISNVLGLGYSFVAPVTCDAEPAASVLSSINSIYSEKNYNSGGVVAEQSIQDARPVVVTLYHDRSHPSALQVPLGQPEPHFR